MGGIKTFEETKQHTTCYWCNDWSRGISTTLYGLGQLCDLDAPDRFDIMQQMIHIFINVLLKVLPFYYHSFHILGLFQNLLVRISGLISPVVVMQRGITLISKIRFKY